MNPYTPIYATQSQLETLTNATEVVIEKLRDGIQRRRPQEVLVQDFADMADEKVEEAYTHLRGLLGDFE